MWALVEDSIKYINVIYNPLVVCFILKSIVRFKTLKHYAFRSLARIHVYIIATSFLKVLGCNDNYQIGFH